MTGNSLNPLPKRTAAMYTLYRLGPESILKSALRRPDVFYLSYDWSSYENREWRPCVEHFVNEVVKLGREVIPVSSPPFTLGEDFAEIVYLIDGSRTVFMSDQLLFVITITSEDSSVLRRVWGAIGDKMGWVSQ